MKIGTLFFITLIGGLAGCSPVTKDSISANPEETVYVLYEDSINRTVLPFQGPDLKSVLDNLFPKLDIEKIYAEQSDGPDHILYFLKKSGNDAGFVSMDGEDSLKLEKLILKDSSLFVDQYGIKIGTTFGLLKKKRNDVKYLTDFHQRTYVYSEQSKIRYEIFGDASIPDSADYENLSFKEEEILDWKVTSIIWTEN